MTLTARPRRRVTSFVRRSARMNPSQRRAWDGLRERWVLTVPQQDTGTSVAAGARLDLPEVYGRRAPLIVEVGPGFGDSLVPMAAARPGCDLLGFEVFAPATASLLARLDRAGVANVRIAPVDAVDGFRNLLGPASVGEVWTFFPDPWPKARHHKRRLVGPEFADLVASRLAPGGRWRLATDWPGYAERIRAVLEAHPAFTPDRPDRADRPITRFEQRGVDAGRPITEFCYRLGEGTGR